ncbi:Signal peptidase I T [bioreactor metagenome]|uniref:Signal peptidase I T n=1 Tax=bioreactor metagenome TaxID=1076179 RepID=A0A645DFQ0_9ZZZZ
MKDTAIHAGEIVWKAIRNFFLPRPNRWFFLRLGVTALVAFLVFKYALVPCVISGASMEPTVHSNGFTFCWRGKYLRHSPQRGDIVIIKYDRGIYFLKRVVGMPGEMVSFRDGKLYINGSFLDEPYVVFPSDWDMDPVKVGDGEYYVVGDNRSMPFAQHQKGVVRTGRIIGAPLF